MPTSDEDAKLLKVMIAAAKKNPVNIGICMGKKPENAVVIMDRKRNPDALGRAAKKAGETAKVAVGILTVDGRDATLQCEGKPPSGVAKQLKLYFKSIDIPLTFALLDENGNPIADDENEGIEGQGTDADVVTALDQDKSAEEAARTAWEAALAAAEQSVADAIRANPDIAGKLRAVRDFAMGKAEEGEFAAAQKSLQTLLGLIPRGGQPSVGQNQPKTETTPDAKVLVEQLKALKVRIAGVQGDAASGLNDAYTLAVEHLKSGRLGPAAQDVDRLNEAVDKAGTASGNTGTDPDPKLAKVTQAVEKLRGLVEALPASVGQHSMLTILASLGDAIARGEAEAALSTLKRVQDGVKLQTEIDRLAPLVARAASTGMVADVNGLKLLFDKVSGTVPAPDHAKAMAALARVETMISAGSSGPSSFQQDIPDDVRPFAISRLEWGKTRGTMREQLEILQSEIVAACTTAGGLQAVTDGVDKLFDYILKLDDRLEIKLDQIVSSPAGDGREALKAEARTLLGEYSEELKKPFFMDVDTGNGFANVAVASTARAALAEISRVLGG